MVFETLVYEQRDIKNEVENQGFINASKAATKLYTC